MGHIKKTIEAIKSGGQDKNILFSDLINVLVALGFCERIKGDHHIFTKTGIDEIINVQPTGNKAKSYQVRQLRNLILKYKIGGENE